jgi:hypothetical protein
MGRPQVRAGLVVAVRAPSQVLRVAAAKLCGEMFVCFRSEAGGPGGVHGSSDGELHAKVQGLGRAVAAPRRVAAAARRAPGVLVRAVRVTAPARWRRRRAGFCCFVISLSISLGLWASTGTAPGPLDSEDAVAGLRGTYGVCGIWRAAK